MTNVVVANLSKSRFYRCPPLYQYNYGMVLRITGVDLPDAYQVDFADDINGQSITQVGGADGVTIPSQFFQPGQAIYCWLRVHPTADSGITIATIVIPISPRAAITDEEPTPVEQSAIDEAIAALNTAVEHVDDAVEHYPTITNGIWHVWDVDAGEYVSTGIPAQGAQGNPGADGQDGADGADGYSPTAIVIRPTGQRKTYITITDKNGTTGAVIADGSDGAPGQDGQDGQDGVSPTITSSEVTGGHRLTITDVNGTSTVDVMDGVDGTNGTNGTDGTTFTPSVASNGDLSWTNDGGKTNPTTVNIKGPAGTSGEMTVETVTGTTPSITGVNNHRYICGEVSTLDITLPASGIVDVVFQSGSTATVLTVTPPTGVTLKWANGFDPTSLDANATYEINIMDGLGVAASWT